VLDVLGRCAKIGAMRCVIYLARHGETDWNRDGRWQGWADVPLNVMGESQARALAERLRNRGISRVVASDLTRARQTAEIVAQALLLSPTAIDPELRERGFGLFEGLTRDECASRHPDHWAIYRADATLPPGAEPAELVIERMCRAVRRASSDPGTALIVTHGSALRAFVRAVTGSTLGPLPNGALLRATALAGTFVEVTPIDVA
jgi:broad specificity phosphatase PhoE